MKPTTYFALMAAHREVLGIVKTLDWSSAPDAFPIASSEQSKLQDRSIEGILSEILEVLRDNLSGDRLWSTKELARYFGVHANSVDRLVAEPTFPRPIQLLGEKTRRWQPDEVKQWCSRRRA